MEQSHLFFDKKDLKYCGKDVIIGKTVRIRKPSETIILDGSIIDDFTYISCGITIGRYCHIASNVSISGGAGHFEMGDCSTLSNGVSVHCASSDYREMGLDLPSVPREFQFGGEVGNVKLGKFVVVGAHSCILPNVNIPDGAAFGAYTLIKSSYELLKYHTYVGNSPKEWRDLGERTGQEKLENIKEHLKAQYYVLPK